MIRNPIQFIISGSGTYLDTQRGAIKAMSNNISVVQIIAPYPITTVVKVNYLIYDILNEPISDYMPPKVGSKGKDVLPPEHPLYQQIAEWDVWEVPVGQRALARIGKYRAGRVGVSFTFKTRYQPEGAVTLKGMIGRNNDLPAAGTAIGDYYICDRYNYTSAVLGEKITKNDVIIWDGTTWKKPPQESLINQTETIPLAVDPTVHDEMPPDITEEEALEELLVALMADVNTAINYMMAGLGVEISEGTPESGNTEPYNQDVVVWIKKIN